MSRFEASNVKQLANLNTQIQSNTASLADIVTVNIKSSGAKGDGIADDTSVIQQAINNSPVNSIINFGTAVNTFILTSAITLLPNRKYIGNATLKQTSSASGTVIFKVSNAQNVTIDGLTFDANNIGSCIQTNAPSSSQPTSYVHIRNCTFKNTPANSTWAQHSGIWALGGFHWGSIQRNSFINCGEGVSIGNPHFSIISDNYFDGMTSGNCIWLINYSQTFAYGDGLIFKNNIGHNLYNAGITFFNSGGDTTKPEGAVIDGNVFKDWQPTAPANDYSTCFSIVTGKNMIISNNKMLNGIGLYGIELGTNNVQCLDNEITNFQNGIILNGNSNAVVNGNHITGSTGSGIIISGASAPNAKISNNMVLNCNKGITIGVQSNNLIISNNHVLNTTNGNGIEIVNGSDDSVISNNLIIDPNSNGISANIGSGTVNRLKISNNKVSFTQSRSNAPTGIYITSITDSFINGNVLDTSVGVSSINYTALLSLNGTINGCTVSDNKITGNISTPIDHRGITAGGGTNLTNAYIINNVVRGLTNGIHLPNASSITNVIIRANHTRECTSPYQFKGTEVTDTKRISESSAVPSNNKWKVADIIYNTSPASAGYIGWVCTANGTACTTAWAATTAYTVGQTVYVSNRVYQCTVAGTSGSTTPSNTSGTSTDGTVTWTFVDYLAVFKTFGVIS